MRLPAKIQHFVAGDWLLIGWVTLFMLVGAALAVSASGLTPIADLASVFWLACIAVLGAVMGYYFSIVAGLMILSRFYSMIGKWNGAPYEPGDQVRILRGAHQGRIVVVKRHVTESNIVLVDLPEECFFINQVCRA